MLQFLVKVLTKKNIDRQQNINICSLYHPTIRHAAHDRTPLRFGSRERKCTCGGKTGEARNLDTFADAAGQIAQNPRCLFIIYLDGSQTHHVNPCRSSAVERNESRPAPQDYREKQSCHTQPLTSPLDNTDQDSNILSKQPCRIVL